MSNEPVSNSSDWEWACPACGASASQHGQGRCSFLVAEWKASGVWCPEKCDGFLPDVDQLEEALKDETSTHIPASCSHCGWNGPFGLPG